MNLRVAVQAADAENQGCSISATPAGASTSPGPRASAPVEFPVDMASDAATNVLVTLLA